MWADLPRDLVQLQSNCAESGTTFIRRRTDEPLSPLRLVRMMMHADDGLEDLAGQMYGGYLDYADVTPDRMLGHDHHDLFYWEQRVGRWGWQKFTDGDLGHRILLPFNDRVLLETMLSLPYPQRAAKVLFERLFSEVAAARLPSRPAPAASSVARSVARAVGGGAPGPVGRLGRRVAGRVERGARERLLREAEARLAWARGLSPIHI